MRMETQKPAYAQAIGISRPIRDGRETDRLLFPAKLSYEFIPSFFHLV